MPELRKDPLNGRWVIISTERAQRPNQFQGGNARFENGASDCPFCEGNEAQTPPEIRALRDGGEPNGPGWRVRVVPNKFPALGIGDDLRMRADGVYDIMDGIGAHEVIVESPRHQVSITESSPEQLAEVLGMYKDRLSDLKKDRKLVYAQIFKNVGEQAGASLEHGHSQLICTPIVPLRVENQIRRAAQYHEFRGRCLMCDMIEQEFTTKDRVVQNGENFLSFEPFAPRFPFETTVVPKTHMSHYENIPDERVPELAAVLHSAQSRIESVVDHPPYNWILNTGPLNSADMDHYHWYFSLIPRLTRVAGFEFGSGFNINPLPPENAARFLRDAKVKA